MEHQKIPNLQKMILHKILPTRFIEEQAVLSLFQFQNPPFSTRAFKSAFAFAKG